MKLSELLEAASHQVKEQEDLVNQLVQRCDYLEDKAIRLERKNYALSKKLNELGGIFRFAACILENIDKYQ